LERGCALARMIHRLAHPWPQREGLFQRRHCWPRFHRPQW